MQTYCSTARSLARWVRCCCIEGGHAAYFANILQHSPFFGQVGAVLLHEGGHAAYFANMLQHSPFFG